MSSSGSPLALPQITYRLVRWCNHVIIRITVSVTTDKLTGSFVGVTMSSSGSPLALPQITYLLVRWRNHVIIRITVSVTTDKLTGSFVGVTMSSSESPLALPQIPQMLPRKLSSSIVISALNGLAQEMVNPRIDLRIWFDGGKNRHKMLK